MMRGVVGEPLTLSYVEEFEVPAGELTPADPFEHSQAVAEYIGDMITQLESMSRAAGFDLLVYLLSMARVEAETNARGIRQLFAESRAP
jgi:hypothetical protein